MSIYRDLKQKARDCGGCARRRKKIADAWDSLTGRRTHETPRRKRPNRG